jgi:DNA-binding MarR family transcriptional regulator
MEKTPPSRDATSYQLDLQIGFVLRRATQRHLAIFGQIIPDLTPTQFAALAKLHEVGPLSQNALGRLVAMDAATIKGVVDRLVARGLLETARDPTDRRRTIVDLSAEGRAAYQAFETAAENITTETLAPLSPDEQAQLLALLARIT